MYLKKKKIQSRQGINLVYVIPMLSPKKRKERGSKRQKEKGN
jgi:hypothetical protein